MENITKFFAIIPKISKTLGKKIKLLFRMSNQPMLEVKLLNPDAKLREKFSKEAAGFDLFNATEFIVFPDQQLKIYVGISISISSSYYG